MGTMDLDLNQSTAILLVGLVITIWGLKDVFVVSNADLYVVIVGIGILVYGSYQWLVEAEPAVEGAEGDGEAPAATTHSKDNT